MIGAEVEPYTGNNGGLNDSKRNENAVSSISKLLPLSH